jgi:hypothetical protein
MGFFDAFNDSRTGNSTPLLSSINAIDYLKANAKNENLNIVIISLEETEEVFSTLTELILKAKENNVKISACGQHDYKLTYLAINTGGFYCYNNFRTFLFSMNKILNKKYFTSSFDITITNVSGIFFY